MDMARNLHDYLTREQISYEVLAHPHTGSSMETATAAQVPGDQLAKGVIVEDDRGYLVAVVPSTHRVQIGVLARQLGRRDLRLATERELGSLFGDCELGAVPPVGGAYGLPCIVEQDLAAHAEIFIEAGDHEHLVRLSQAEFGRLMADATRGHFSRHL